MWPSQSIYGSIVLLIYLFGVLCVGIYVSRKKDRCSKGFFFGDGSIGWLVFGASWFLTNCGRLSSLFSPFFPNDLTVIAALVVLGVLFLPLLLLRSRGIIHPVEQFWKNQKGKLWSSFLSILVNAVQIFLVLSLCRNWSENVTGIDYTTTAVTMVVFVGMYTVIGGGTAVMWTQALQTAVFLIGVIAALVMHQGIDTLVMTTVPTMEKGLTGAFAALPVLALWVWWIDRSSLQKILSVKDSREVWKGAYVTAGLLVVIVVLVALLSWTTTNNESVVQRTSGLEIAQTLGRPFLIAGMFALLMSILAGSFNSIGTLCTTDFYTKIHPDATERELVLVGRLTTTAVIVMTILMIPLTIFLGVRSFIFLTSVLLYGVPPVVAVTLFSLHRNGQRGIGGLLGLILGELIGVGRFLVQEMQAVFRFDASMFGWYATIDAYQFAIILFCFTAIVVMLVNIVTPSNASERSVAART